MKPEQTKNQLSAVLRAELARLGVSAAELARRGRMPQQTVATYLQGGREPTLSRLLALERGLGRPAGWLCRRVSESAPAG